MFSIGQLVRAKQDAASSVDGYLKYEKGHLLKVRYVGQSSDEVHWLYCESWSEAGGEGWVAVGDVAGVENLKATRNATMTASGYLNFRKGQVLKLLYVGLLPDEVGWIYCESLSKAGDKTVSNSENKGWVSVQDVGGDVSEEDAREVNIKGSEHASLIVGSVVVVQGDYEGVAKGYLSVRQHQRLRVLYLGKDADLGWMYAAKLDGVPEEGWIPQAFVATASRNWGKGYKDPRLVGLMACMPTGPAPSIPKSKGGSCSHKGGKDGKCRSSKGAGGQDTRGSGKGMKRGHACQKPLPPYTRRCIRVVSLGLRTLEDRALVKGAGKALGEETAEAVVLKACREQCNEQDTAIVVLDACIFSDAINHLMSHFGSNGSIVLAIRNQASFRTWLSQARRSIYSGWKAKRKMMVAVYCETGEHCSVALAMVLEHVLTHPDEGFALFEEAEDISRHRLFREEDLCRCEDCRTPSEKLTAVLEHVWQDWIDISLDAGLRHCADAKVVERRKKN